MESWKWRDFSPNIFALFNSYVNSRVSRSRSAASLATCEHVSPGVTLTNIFFVRRNVFLWLYFFTRAKQELLFFSPELCFYYFVLLIYREIGRNNYGILYADSVFNTFGKNSGGKYLILTWHLTWLWSILMYTSCSLFLS